jgi:hypothetical protein
MLQIKIHQGFKHLPLKQKLQLHQGFNHPILKLNPSSPQLEASNLAGTALASPQLEASALPGTLQAPLQLITQEIPLDPETNPFSNSGSQERGKYRHPTLSFPFNKSSLIRQTFPSRIRLHHHQAFHSLWMIWLLKKVMRHLQDKLCQRKTKQN